MKKILNTIGKLPAKQQNALVALTYTVVLIGLCYMILLSCGKG